LKEIVKADCPMLNDKLDGSETKEVIVKYLHRCDCPVLKEKFSLE